MFSFMVKKKKVASKPKTTKKEEKAKVGKNIDPNTGVTYLVHPDN